MPGDEVPPRGGRLFYRRVAPSQWEETIPKRPIVEVFVLRPADINNGLSVFDAGVSAPQDTLQTQLVLWLRLSASPQEKERRRGETLLAKYGRTVEEMVARGWGIVSVSEAVFAKYGMAPLPGIDANGHVLIGGGEAAFLHHCGDLAEECVVLSDDVCRGF